MFDGNLFEKDIDLLPPGAHWAGCNFCPFNNNYSLHFLTDFIYTWSWILERTIKTMLQGSTFTLRAIDPRINSSSDISQFLFSRKQWTIPNKKRPKESSIKISQLHPDNSAPHKNYASRQNLPTKPWRSGNPQIAQHQNTTVPQLETPWKF